MVSRNKMINEEAVDTMAKKGKNTNIIKKQVNQ